MIWIDLVFIAAIVLSVIYSFARGMIREFFALLALAAGVFLGLKATPMGVHALSPQLATPLVASIVTFIIVSIFTGLVLLFVGSLLAHAAQTFHLGWADRLLGAAFGFAKGILFVAVAVLVIAAVQPAGSSWIQRSRIAAAVSGIASKACSSLPPEASEPLKRRLDELRNPVPGARTVTLPAVSSSEPGRSPTPGTPPSRS